MIPPSDNMGVTNPAGHPFPPCQTSIDWLQYSVEWPSALRSFPTGGYALHKVLESALPPDSEIGLSGEIGYGGKGYTDSMTATHARIFWHRLNRMQHIGVLMTGSDLQAMLTIPYPHDALVRWTVAKCKKIARIDFALDVFDPRGNPLDILGMWKRGDVGTQARTIQRQSTYTTTTDGVVVEAPTVYVGSVDADRRMRIYDKAKEQGRAGHWTRLEIQMRDARAWSLAKACATFGIERAGKTAIREFLHVPKLAWWNAALTGEAVSIDPVSRRETNTDRWIREVCIPAINKRAKELIAAGNWSLYDALEKELADILRGSKND